MTLLFVIAGLPMSVSSTSSLKSSGTFNSNSSINSTPSIDRYAALKDLDEQLREMKEKETYNTQPTVAPPANPFNISSAQTTAPGQPNPFQAAAPQMLWPNEQQTNLFSNGFNGQQQQQQPMYPLTNGNTFNGQQYQNKLAGTQFNGSIQNGFQQPNPFAVCISLTFFIGWKIFLS